MPTYDYLCSACGHEFEKFQSMKDDPLKSCPKCKKRQVRRLIGMGAGVIFKGSGFYETDYKRAGREKKKDSVDGKSGGDASGKSESKPKSGTKAKKGSSGSDSGKGATKKADS